MTDDEIGVVIDKVVPLNKARRADTTGEASSEPAGSIRPIRFAELDGKTPPERRYAVQDWLPIGCVTSLYGPGGIGKSLLAQQIAACITTGREFFGAKVEPGPVLGLMAEDDDDELWRRQLRINKWLGITMAELGELHLQGRAGLGNTLAVYPANAAPIAEPFYELLQKAARRLRPRLIVLDPIAQLYGGNENDRYQVSHFCNLVAGLAREFDCAVLLLGHPAKADGSEFSGSTAWNASVRSRLLLQRKEGEEGVLLFSRLKSNYAKPDALPVRWSDGGVLCPVATQHMTMADRIDAEGRAGACRQAFLGALDKLTAQGRNVSHGERTGNYAPRVMLETGTVEGLSKPELAAAMNELLNEGRIEANSVVGRAANRHRVHGLARTGADG